MKFVPRIALVASLLVLWPILASSLTVALDDNYPPYSFRNSLGTLQGVAVDQWALWSQKTGEPVELLGLPWNKALDAMASGRADVLDTVFLTPEREKRWLFTDPYATIQIAVFHREGLTGIGDPRDLKGAYVGVKSGDASADALRQAGLASLVEYPDYSSLVDAAIRGDILAFCMDAPPAIHLLFVKGVSAQFRQGFVLSQDSFRRAVNRTHPELLARVNHGFTLLSAAEKAQIERRWLGTPLSRTGRMWYWAVLATVAAVALVLIPVLLLLRARLKRLAAQKATLEKAREFNDDRNRALFAALPDLLYITNFDGMILETLASVRNHLYHDPERFVGSTIGEVFGSAVGAETRRRMEDLEKSGGLATVEAELEIRGEVRCFEARIARLADGRFLCIVRDVSETRRAWKDDLHRNKLESLGLLAGGLAHDFNNSLGVIQGFVSLARLQLADPAKALGSLDKAIQATRRAAGLTGQLRVLAQGGEVHRTLVSVRSLAEESAAFALVGSPCILVVEVNGGPWTVRADPDQLSQVFHNLVLNSVQAMLSGGTITLVLRRVAGAIQVSVVDEGVGISTENLQHVFDPYFTTKPRGTGLGLPVVQAVVQRHGGTLEVESREGNGTVFTVTLPAADEEAPEGAAPPEMPLYQFSGTRALLMDDDDLIRELLVEVCSSLGLEPTACRDGAEAEAAFDAAVREGRPYELLVSDLLVPGGMGGRELITRLRTRPGTLRALAVTGFSVDRSAEDFRNEGFDVIMGKPFTVDELKRRILELMKKPWKAAPNS